MTVEEQIKALEDRVLQLEKITIQRSVIPKQKLDVMADEFCDEMLMKDVDVDKVNLIRLALHDFIFKTINSII